MPTTAEMSTTPPHQPLSKVIAREERSRTRRRISWVVAGVVLVAGGGAGTWLLRKPPLTLAQTYRTEAVRRGPVVRQIAATGRVEARVSVEVGAQVSGRIESVLADYNDEVEAGQVLARFDTRSLEAQAAQAKAAIAAARASHRHAKLDQEDADRRLRRVQRLHDRGIESQESLELARSAVQLAQSAVDAAAAEINLRRAAADLATANLEYAEVRAPIRGVIISRDVQAGQTVAAAFQTPVLFVIAADLEQMSVVTSIDEADMGDAKPGQHAQFTVDAFPDDVFEAQVTALRSAPKIVQNVVTYEAVLWVDNPRRKLRPGMTASVKIETAAEASALLVPNAALRFVPPGPAGDPAAHTVWTLGEEELVAVHVTPGVSDGSVTAIADDDAIAEGTLVVVDLTPEGRRLVEAEHD
jgi:HlyD family secretion protein